MDFLEKISKDLARTLYWVAGIAIVSMMLLTCADVILRLGVTVYHKYHWFFLSPFKPIPGTYELVCFLGAVAVSFAMAHTSVEKGHVAVSLVVRMFPERIQAIIDSITSSFGFILFALISWRSVLYGNHLRASGEVSLTLQLPFYPFVYGIAFAAAALCLVLFVDLSKNLAKVFGK
ncbi:MAG: TRAP transporter small permease [Deltaproteobacteria bacterium]|jgi:TRAP-type C4-dicarboxylate transport system permease small subunit|nr:MAG: TRAP transporter small permease [Deltaproteobacteria bacterium]